MIKLLKTNWLILLIVLIASILRLYRIDAYAEFLGDQGRDLIIIRDFLVNGNLFFIGPQTSVGNMYLGPYFYYLIAPSLILSNFNPIGPAIFVALIGIATVWLTYFTVNRIFYNRSAALIASFLFAISPAAIKYSTFSWNPNVMPFFSILFVYFIYQAFNFHKYRNLIWATLAFIMCFNSHFLALLLLPVAAVYFFYEIYVNKKLKNSNNRLLFTYSLISAIIFLVSLAPLILFDFKHNGQNIGSFINFFAYRETTVNLKLYKSFFQIIPVASTVTSSLFSLSQKYISNIIIALFSLMSSFYIYRQSKNRQSLVFIYSWLIAGLLGLGLYKQHLYTHYFGFLFPFPFIITGLLVTFYAKLLNKFIPQLFSLALFTLIISLPLILSSHLRHPPQNQILHAQNLASAISRHITVKDGKFNVTMLASYNDFRAQAVRYFLIKNKIPDLLSSEEYPQSDTLFVIQDDPSKWSSPLMSDIWEINVFQPQFINDTFTSSDQTNIIKLSKHEVN